YLHQLDVGGQDWNAFFTIWDPIVTRWAREYQDLFCTVLQVGDTVNEFRLRTYQKWVPEYLHKELRREAPRSFNIFLYDRFRDYLRGIRERETHRRLLLEVEFPDRHINGTHRSSSTGAKVDVGTHGSNGFSKPLWSSGFPPETLTRLREMEASLSNEEARQIIILLIEGWTYEEIGDFLGLSTATICRRVEDIHETLRSDGEVSHEGHVSPQAFPQKRGKRL